MGSLCTPPTFFHAFGSVSLRKENVAALFIWIPFGFCRSNANAESALTVPAASNRRPSSLPSLPPSSFSSRLDLSSSCNAINRAGGGAAGRPAVLTVFVLHMRMRFRSQDCERRTSPAGAQTRASLPFSVNPPSSSPPTFSDPPTGLSSPKHQPLSLINDLPSSPPSRFPTHSDPAPTSSTRSVSNAARSPNSSPFPVHWRCSTGHRRMFPEPPVVAGVEADWEGHFEEAEFEVGEVGRMREGSLGHSLGRVS